MGKFKEIAIEQSEETYGQRFETDKSWRKKMKRQKQRKMKKKDKTTDDQLKQYLST